MPKTSIDLEPRVFSRSRNWSTFSSLASAVIGQPLNRTSDGARGRVVFIVQALAMSNRPDWMPADCWSQVAGYDARRRDRVVVAWEVEYDPDDFDSLGSPPRSAFTVFKVPSIEDVAASSDPPPSTAWIPLTHLLRVAFGSIKLAAQDTVLEQEEI